MVEINLGKRITIIPGVRYEKAHNEYTANENQARYAMDLGNSGYTDETGRS